MTTTVLVTLPSGGRLSMTLAPDRECDQLAKLASVVPPDGAEWWCEGISQKDLLDREARD